MASSRFLTRLVDENLFYKGVDKSSVHGARLHQHVHVAESPSVVGREPPSGSEQPPYPFKSGDSLLNLTRVHNVRLILSYSPDGLLRYKFEISMISSLAHNLSKFAKDFVPWRPWARAPPNHHNTC
jgi:hypothetical protein